MVNLTNALLAVNPKFSIAYVNLLAIDDIVRYNSRELMRDLGLLNPYICVFFPLLILIYLPLTTMKLSSCFMNIPISSLHEPTSLVS